MGKSLVLLFLWVATSVVAPSISAQEPNDSEGEIRYISDDLFTYLHAGPGRNFRILGSVVAGTRVTLLQINDDNDFVEIIDDKQRTGWVDAGFINTTASVKELVPGLQQELQQSKQTRNLQSADIELLNQQIEALSAQNSGLQARLDNAEQNSAEISSTLEEYDQTAEMEWFTRGGIVAIVSLFLGILLTYLPKKRRRNDNWM
jgi:SH3 domain protein